MPGRRASVSTSLTASARRRCCTSSCRTRPATSATAPPADRCRATRCGWSTKRARSAGRRNRRAAGRSTLGRPRATGISAAKRRQTFQGPWTYTGDKYTRDADGRYTLLRPCRRHVQGLRHLGLAVRGRERADRAPAVLEAAVVPEADSDGLLKPKAFVVLRPDCKTDGLLETLKEHVKQKIGPWKYPRWIDVVDLLAEDRDGEDPALQAAGWARNLPSRARACDVWFTSESCDMTTLSPRAFSPSATRRSNTA